MPLKGVKVLEFAGLAPGPFCGMVLADFGASVLRINKINDNVDIDCLGNGKKSIAINLKKPEGIAIIKKISRTSDVLIEPFRSGVMEKLGLGPEVLLKENPRLVYARLTGFGQSGYYSKRAGHDINYLGLSGLLSMFGRKEEKPMFPVNFAADFGGGGLMCALGIVFALYNRSNTGKGQVIDANMVEGASYLGSWLFRSQNMPYWGRERGENVLDSGAHFYEVYETKDGKFMSVGAIEPQFYDELLDGLGIDDLDQFEFKKGKELFTAKFLEKTQDEWSEIFDQKDACVFPVLSRDDVMKNRHNKERNSFFNDKAGNVAPQPAPRLSRTPGASKALDNNPECGSDTENALKEIGYSDKDISELVDNGVVQMLCKL